MINVYKNIYIGNQEDCMYDEAWWAVVHACKHPCHKKAVGYPKNLPTDHKNYLYYIQGRNLYLNMIDTHSPIFDMDLFKVSCGFIKSHEKQSIDVLVHCNKAWSRSAAIIFLYLSRETDLFDISSYDNAREDYNKLYNSFIPKAGIDKYFRRNWKELISF